MKCSPEYLEAVEAAEDFAQHRSVERIRERIPLARLFHSGLRALDVYGPLRRLVEGDEGYTRAGGQDRGLSWALALLEDLRYHPCYRDHRILPLLRQYHRALTFLFEGLEGTSDQYRRLLALIEEVTGSNGVLTVDWRVGGGPGTLYPTVGLRVTRLLAGEHFGLYRVRVAARGRVPHHSHTYLEEHHFLPEAIQGVHQLGGRAAWAGRPDIIYIPRGVVHAFRNDEERDREFLFICGSEETGPWDFVHDIKLHQDLEFPEEGLHETVEGLGGVVLEGLKERFKAGWMRPSPKDMRLAHQVGIVEGSQPLSAHQDRIIYVAEGRGRLWVEGRPAQLEEGAAATLPGGLESVVEAEGGMVLHLFEWV